MGELYLFTFLVFSMLPGRLFLSTDGHGQLQGNILELAVDIQILILPNYRIIIFIHQQIVVQLN